MQQLQPQPEVTPSLQFNTNSTPISAENLALAQRFQWVDLQTEAQQVDWLILHLNHWFSHLNVTLIRGDFEPEYFPASEHSPARIQFQNHL